MEEHRTGWVVINESHPTTGNALLLTDSFALTRKDSIKKFCEGSGSDWKHWRTKWNFKCVKAQSLIQTL